MSVLKYARALAVSTTWRPNSTKKHSAANTLIHIVEELSSKGTQLVVDNRFGVSSVWEGAIALYPFEWVPNSTHLLSGEVTWPAFPAARWAMHGGREAARAALISLMKGMRREVWATCVITSDSTIALAPSHPPMMSTAIPSSPSEISCGLKGSESYAIITKSERA